MTHVPAGLMKESRKKSKKRVDVAVVYDPCGARPRGFTQTQTTTQCRMVLDYQTDAWKTTSTTLQTLVALNFKLSDCSGYANLTGTFDQYLIEQIEVIIDPADPSATTGYPSFASALDIDDSNTPGSFANVQDRAGSIVTGGAAGHYHRFQPNTAIAVYSGAFTSFGSVPAGWIDCASSTVQHYGMKAAWGVGAVAQIYNLSVRMLVSFRGGQLA